MLRVLLESRARRHRHTGGMVLSIAAHLAIIVAVTATSVHATRPRRQPVAVVRLVPPAAPRPVERHSTTRQRAGAPHAPPVISVDRIHAPISSPTVPPVVDLTPSLASSIPTDGVSLERSGATTTGLLSLIGGDGPPDDTEWRGTELLMRIVRSAAPRYPEALRQAEVEGRVVVRFTVDTAGRIDLSSVELVESTHDLFARAVRNVLGTFRFKPAEIAGRRVSAKAEMPFEFRIRK